MQGYQRIVAALCRDQAWPAPEAEHVFAPPRKWRLGLAWPERYLAVEIHGGNFKQGAHVQGARLRREYEKLNEAALKGWVVLQVLPEQVTDGVLGQLLARYFKTMWPQQFGDRRVRSVSRADKRNTL